MRWRTGVMLLASVLAVAHLVAQTPRDGVSITPMVGTGVIRGVTVDADARPLRRVTVTLTMTDNGRAVRVVTDDAGRFAFAALPAARYTLAASKANYVPFTYGAKSATLPGSVMVLREGQQLDLESLRLVRAAVITGTVFGGLGRPLGDALVSVVPVQLVGGVPMPTGMNRGGSVDTDDRGVYRVSGLAPGTYLVQLYPPSNVQYHPVTDSEFSWATQPAGATPVPPAQSSAVYSLVFHPSAVDPSAAVPVTVGPGEERTGVDIRLQFVPTSRISGMVIGPDGQAVRGAVVATIGTASGVTSPLAPVAGRVQGASLLDGTFVLTGVSPGQRMFFAATMQSSSGEYFIPSGPEMPPNASLLIATQDMEVTGSDVSGMTLRLRKSPAISGRMVFLPGTRPAPDPTGLYVALSPEDRNGMGSIGDRTRADGTFTLTGILPGRFRLSLNAPEGWFAKTAMYRGQDLLDTFVDMLGAGDQAAEVVVTLTDRMGEISGTLMDGAGKPAPQFYVELFSTDRANWVSGARRTKTARASSDGRFTFANLPAGDYYLCALTEYDPATSSDPKFLEQLVAQSVRITLGDGEKKTQDLRLK